MIGELKNVWEEGSEEEQEILRLALQAIRQKRERNSSFISGFLGLKGELVDERTYRFHIPITVFMHNSSGAVHGGLLATLVDSVMGSLVNRSLSPEEYAVTTELKMNYLRPGKGETLRAEATFLHRGQTLVVMEASVYDDRNKRVAHGTGTFMVLKRP
ncbi:PaaI family thioesterase [Brevibacillus nitrificans]|uniref:PaaI family thioesterase n=1 Tax=Brevibacillus nitrificans TaxID=651560 RepID=UPI002606933B|nr:PaaI family thioesterase [Brevibacillus nitrificans]MED1796103.1 PaaI family thioesterase [Brevibacillus nitrificans]